MGSTMVAITQASTTGTITGRADVGAPQQRDDEQADQRDLAGAHPGIVDGLHRRDRLVAIRRGLGTRR